MISPLERLTKILRNAICIAGLLTFAACSAGEEEAPEERLVVWHKVGSSAGADNAVWLPGRLQAANRSQLSFEVPGVVSSVRAQIGDRVGRGEVLAVLDSRAFQLETTRANAQLAETNARLQVAEKDAVRQGRLLKAGAASQSRYERAVAERSGLRAVAKAQKAQIGIASKSLSDTRMRAPFSGRIARRAIEPSQQVGAGQIVFEIDGIGQTEAVFSATASQRQRLSIGGTVQLRAGRSTEETTTARISKISGRGNASGLYEVIAVLDGAPPAFSPGATVDIAIAADSEATENITIPITALIPVDDNQAQVFVINPKTDKISLRKISIARLAEDRAIIRSGLKRGTLIVERGVAFLSDGQTVARLGNGAQRFE